MSFDATVGVDKSHFTITDGTNEVEVYANPGITLRQFVEMDTLSRRRRSSSLPCTSLTSSW